MSDMTADVTTAETQSTAPTDSSTVETNVTESTHDDSFLAGLTGQSTPAAAEQPEAPKTDTEGDTPKSEPSKQEAEKPKDGEQTEETEGEEPSKPKNAAENRIRTLVDEKNNLAAQNRALKQEIEQLNAKVYAPATEEELVESGMSPEEAKTEVLRQQIEVGDYNNKVVEMNAALGQESLQVCHEFPMFDQNSDQYNKEIAEPIAELYSQVSGMSTDPNTGVINDIKVYPYQFYQTIHAILQTAQKSGEAKGQKAAEAMLAAAEPSTSSAPKQQEEDPFLKGLRGA